MLFPELRTELRDAALYHALANTYPLAERLSVTMPWASPGRYALIIEEKLGRNEGTLPRLVLDTFEREFGS
jgi:hypothetical protein